MKKKIISSLLAFCFLPVVLVAKDPGKKPKNIILMVGDGTGLAQLCAAYASNGFSLNIFALAQAIGLSNTSSFDDFITDSAAGADAFSYGEKSKNGMLGLAPDSTSRETICETAHKRGKATGLVVTCALTHATPAAFYAHYPNRDSNLAIANFFYQGNIDIAYGGGYPYFDSLKLVQSGYHVTMGPEQMQRDAFPKQVGFFSRAPQLPRVDSGRGTFLPAASMHAIEVLNANKKGFFLMIEGSQIDWGGHDNDSNYVINEALDFDATAKKVIDWARADGNTLVIITADHECGGLTLTGYDKQNGKPRMDFSTTHHTAIMVPVFAFGPGAEQFTGVYENTEIYYKMMALMKLKK